MIGRGEGERLHTRAQAVAASEVDAQALARELARADVVSIDRQTLGALITLGVLGVRTEDDADVIARARRIARTATGAT